MTLESPLDSKEFEPVNLKGNQSWIFIERIYVEAEAPILWPPDEKRPVGKDPDAGKVWRQEEKGITEDGMVGWHNWLNVQESEQTVGDSEGQGSLACSIHGVAELDMTDWLNKNNNIQYPSKTLVSMIIASYTTFIETMSIIY